MSSSPQELLYVFAVLGGPLWGLHVCRILQVCLALSDEALNDAYACTLRAVGHNPWPAYNAHSALLRFGHVPFDAMIIDAQCAYIAGRSFLPSVRRAYPGMRIVAVKHETGGAWPEGDPAQVDAIADCPSSALRALVTVPVGAEPAA